MKVTIYHNPQCGKSRDALRFLRDAGIEPIIVLYIDTGWTTTLLRDLKAATGLGWQEMLRPDARVILQNSIKKNEDAVIIQYVINNPAALERPFVVSDKGTRLCRPIQAIFEIVQARPKSPWLTEKGVPVLVSSEK
jgi:arsenate reductase (glutaredoxin)